MSDPRSRWEAAAIESVHPSWNLGEEAFYESGLRVAGVIRGVWEEFGGPGAPRILDFGAGPGRVAVHLARWAEFVVAEDPNPEFRAQLAHRASVEGLGNLEPAPPSDSLGFDLAVCYAVLIHYPPPEAAAIVASLSRRAPLLALQIPLYPEARWGKDWIDVSVWTPDMLAVVAGALGLEVLSAPANPEPFTFKTIGRHHTSPIVLRRP